MASGDYSEERQQIMTKYRTPTTNSTVFDVELADYYDKYAI